MPTPLEEVKAFFAGWKPYAELPPDSPLAAQVLAVLAEPEPARRRERFAQASDLYRLHALYRELGLFRAGGNDKAARFEALFALPLEELARAMREGRQKDYLGLLQDCFEFGRHAVPPRQHVLREFVLRLFRLEVHGPPLKYSIYAGGVLYTAAGKSHDEMAQDFVRLGLGVGRPLAGGQIARSGPLAFVYDVSSSAFTSRDPHIVKEALDKAIRGTGGLAHKVTLRLDPTRMPA